MTTFAPRSYPVVEVALACWSAAPEHVQEGDIMARRHPQIGIGMNEAKLFLWLLLEGLTAEQYAAWKFPIYEPYDPLGLYEPKTDYTVYDKRRFNIPFSRLSEVVSIDLVRARNPLDEYQPFYTIDQSNHLWLTDSIPLQVSGLVWDKVLGVYL